MASRRPQIAYVIGFNRYTRKWEPVFFTWMYAEQAEWYLYHWLTTVGAMSPGYSNDPLTGLTFPKRAPAWEQVHLHYLSGTRASILPTDLGTGANPKLVPWTTILVRTET